MTKLEKTLDPAEILDSFHIPLSSYNLIELLDKAFPHRCILPHETEVQGRAYAAQRALIDELIEMKNDEHEDIEEKTATKLFQQ